MSATPVEIVVQAVQPVGPVLLTLGEVGITAAVGVWCVRAGWRLITFFIDAGPTFDDPDQDYYDRENRDGEARWS